jgi:DNA-binding HxlR family transcriptional regulator
MSSQPIMTLLDALGRRWALRILWELRGDPLTFRALREASGNLSPSVLNERLRELADLGLIEKVGEGYALSNDGRQLGDLLLPLDAWARRWARKRDHK